MFVGCLCNVPAYSATLSSIDSKNRNVALLSAEWNLKFNSGNDDDEREWAVLEWSRFSVSFGFFFCRCIKSSIVGKFKALEWLQRLACNPVRTNDCTVVLPANSTCGFSRAPPLPLGDLWLACKKN